MEKQVVVITGASAGYGKGAAEWFQKDGGFYVVITSRNKENLEKVAKSIGTDYFVADVMNVEDWKELRKYVLEKYGKIDILINNAGGAVAMIPFSDYTVEQIEECLDLNIKSCALGVHTFINDMKERKNGTIINVASICAKRAWPGLAVYSAAKAAVLLFTKCLHTELQPFNIRCTTFIPAAGRTDFCKNAGNDNRVEMGFFQEDAGRAMYDIVKMPAHVIVEEYQMWGMDQVVSPM